jgi:hypothetical protein
MVRQERAQREISRGRDTPSVTRRTLIPSRADDTVFVGMWRRLSPLPSPPAPRVAIDSPVSRPDLRVTFQRIGPFYF